MELDLAALISSIFAIIIALISGFFSLAAAKRTAKGQTTQSYINILEKRVDTLTGYINDLMKIGTTTSALTDLQNTFNHIWDICEKQSHLFIECENDFLNLESMREEVKLLWGKANTLAGQGRSDLLEIATKKTIAFVTAFDKLMKDERIATVKRIETLAIK